MLCTFALYFFGPFRFLIRKAQEVVPLRRAGRQAAAHTEVMITDNLVRPSVL